MRSSNEPAVRVKGGGAAHPCELPFVGSSFAFAHDPLAYLERLADRHGDVVQFHLPGQTIFVFNHPTHIEQLLVDAREHVIKDVSTRALSIVLGSGLLVSEGELWRTRRRLAQPAFHKRRIEAYAEVMVQHAEHVVARWRDGEQRDLHADMMELTLRIVARTLFGVEIADDTRRIGEAVERLMMQTSGPAALLLLGFPKAAKWRTQGAVAELDAIVFRIIAERRASGDRGDLLSMLLAARDEQGAPLSDRALRDEAITMLLAGHETTALALTYSIHLLSRDPEAWQSLKRELREVLGQRPATCADLAQLRFTEAVVREALRLYPPAWAIGREAIAPFELGGCTIEPGAQLWAVQWTVQRDPRWFDDPLSFRPQRWLDESTRSLPRFAYFPFGGGARVCIGSSFAMMEAVLLLATIARDLRFSPPSTGPLALVPAATLRPKRGLPMIVRRDRRAS